MSRPVTIRDETILEAARAVFLERGIAATTAEVAGRAGVSEGTLFNRFGSKEQLFKAAMGMQIDEPDWAYLFLSRVGTGDVKEHLYELGIKFVEFFQKLVPMLMMVWSNPTMTSGKQREIHNGKHPATRNIRLVMGYLEAEMKAGRLRKQDPEIVARAFMGSLFNYAFLDVATFVHEELPQPKEAFVKGLIAVLWGGMAPPRAASKRKSSSAHRKSR
jgi:AcrR family transcriptional regulator